MKPKAAAFYWTLPVPWAGFTVPFKDVEDAASRSRTIRYQRALVQDWAQQHGFDLVREDVLLELAPDRGSDLVKPALDELAAFCEAQDAVLLVVDFSLEQGWRSHMFLDTWLKGASVRYEAIWPYDVAVDGAAFDPIAHFEDWRDRQAEWTQGKPQRIAAAQAVIAELVAQGRKWKAIALELEKRGLVTPSGVMWNGEIARKLHAGGVGPKA